MNENDAQREINELKREIEQLNENEDDAQREIGSLNRQINELKSEIEKLSMFYDMPDIDTAISFKYVSRLFSNVFMVIFFWFFLLFFYGTPLAIVYLVVVFSYRWLTSL